MKKISSATIFIINSNYDAVMNKYKINIKQIKKIWKKNNYFATISFFN